MIRLSPLSTYGWNEGAGRYIDLASGRFVPFDAVKSELERAVSACSINIERLSDQLIDGEITLAQWQLAMEREVKIGNVAAAALARGGWAQMSPADWGWVGARIKQQYRYLDNFAREIASGRQLLNGRLRVRADLYAGAMRGTFEESRRRYARIYKDAAEERRVLTPGAEHCEPANGKPGCAELAALGWQAVGTLPPIGAATCVTFCQCHFEYRDSKGKPI